MLPIPAAWVLPESAGASVSFARESGTEGQGTSPGSRTPRLTSTALVPFTDMPAQINPTVLIYYSSPARMKIWTMRLGGEMVGCMNPLSGCISVQIGHATYSVLAEYGSFVADSR
eukprot:8893909-Ditylum_brightwellii.AAC.1